MPAPKPAKRPRWASLTAWATSTFYPLHERVNANGNLYVCSQAGTSAGAGGGPAGGGAGIVDGTCTWDFVSAAETLPTVTEPTESDKDAGWAAGQKPPAQFFNWILVTIYLWIVWLEDLPEQVITWIGSGADGGSMGGNASAIFAPGSGNTDGVHLYASGTGIPLWARGLASIAARFEGGLNLPGLDSFGNGTGYGGRFYADVGGAAALYAGGDPSGNSRAIVAKNRSGGGQVSEILTERYSAQGKAAPTPSDHGGKWGAGVTFTVGPGGYPTDDSAGCIEVQPAGAGLAALPILRITFGDGAWTTAPRAMCFCFRSRAGAVIAAPITWLATTTYLDIQASDPADTPTAGDAWTFYYMILGAG